MATLIFDIETVGESWDSLDEKTQTVLSRWIERTARTDGEKKERLLSLKNELGFSPLTGSIVALGMYDLERSMGVVYYTGDVEDLTPSGDFKFKSCSEKELLEDFWDGVQSYDTFVTFNGRSFDVPFILHRSVVCDVKPSIDLMRKRYLTQQTIPYHIDLQDELTFYGAMMKRPSLHMFCRAYGIKSPKENVDGDDVAELFARKQFRDIAQYNAQDVIATTELYKKWREFLAPASFLNTIDF